MTIGEARTTVEEDVASSGDRASQSMVKEVGQSFYLMALMALMMSVYVGLGLLAVRIFG